MLNNILKRQLAYWKKSALDNWQTAEYLFVGERYDACLFFCHLALEKILKGLVIKATGKTPPRVHDLAELAIVAKLNLDRESINHLRIITSFNIAGRYQSAKFQFHKIADKKYAAEYFTIAKRLFLWLKRQSQKK